MKQVYRLSLEQTNWICNNIKSNIKEKFKTIKKKKKGWKLLRRIQRVMPIKNEKRLKTKLGFKLTRWLK